VLRWKARHAERWPDGLRDLDLEYLVYQTLVGAHPLPVERMHTYLDKAMREAKRATSWLDPDDRFERAAHAFVDTLDIDETFQGELAELSARISPAAGVAALSQLALKLTLPGVPDIYQGCELWTDSLVDPDNRRAVDYQLRRDLLQSVADRADPPALDSAAAKLWLTARLLRVRRDHANSFLGPDATYDPLAAIGQDADAAVAFGRGHDIVVVAPIRPLRVVHGGWHDTVVELPIGTWRNVLDPTAGDQRDRLELAALATTYHLAVLVRTSA
jgi:(1->4)-alpha-D-glucan 1-alpha-D-glucosylmutase